MLKHTKWMYRSIPWKMLLKFGTEGTSETKYGRKLMVRMMLSYGKKEYCDLADHGFRIFAQAVEKKLPYEISLILYYAVKRMLPALQNGITETGNAESTVCWYGYLKQDTIPAVMLRIL